MDISIEALKRACGRAAAERVEDGMTLGLGTGSTVKHALIRLAERIREDDLSIVGVATSQMTIDLSQELGIPLIDLPPTGRLDLCIDGADEISPDGNLIKGGGGAAVRERGIALASERFIVIADSTKLVDVLGAFPLPIMAIPFGVDRCISSIDAICQGSVEIRRKEGHVQYDDNGLLIIDASFGPTISDPSALRAEILDIPSVVDVGLFIDLATEAIVATDDGQLKHLEFSTSQ